jgi:hypothetical protein
MKRRKTADRQLRYLAGMINRSLQGLSYVASGKYVYAISTPRTAGMLVLRPIFESRANGTRRSELTSPRGAHTNTSLGGAPSKGWRRLQKTVWAASQVFEGRWLKNQFIANAAATQRDHRSDDWRTSHQTVVREQLGQFRANSINERT